jgi:early secretory antigenic target protein ESAT-6
MKVNFAALQDAYDDLGRAAAGLDQKLSDLHTQAEPLVATWTGAAQVSYNERHTRWTNAANELKGVLVQIQKALGDSLREYLDTEDHNRKIFDQR